ncbi:MAG: hypothetical protein AB4290_11570, partial [Spirulina sp.]
MSCLNCGLRICQSSRGTISKGNPKTISSMLGTFLKKSLWVSLLAVLAVGCRSNSINAPAPAVTSANNATGTIVVGDISDEPAKKIERFQPFADYLAGQLSAIDIGVGAVEVAPSME